MSRPRLEYEACLAHPCLLRVHPFRPFLHLPSDIKLVLLGNLILSTQHNRGRQPSLAFQPHRRRVLSRHHRTRSIAIQVRHFPGLINMDIIPLHRMHRPRPPPPMAYLSLHKGLLIALRTDLVWDFLVVLLRHIPDRGPAHNLLQPPSQIQLPSQHDKHRRATTPDRHQRPLLQALPLSTRLHHPDLHP